MILFSCLLIAAGTNFISAQATATAELRGNVKDPSGATVAGATVTVTDNSKGTTRTVTSDADGNYVILSLPPSTYTVKIDASGFASKTVNNVLLEVGQKLALDVDLTVGDVGAVVDVAAGEAALVDTERTQQSTVISGQQLSNLPINRRNFLDFALLTPGVSDADNVNDSTDFRVAQTPQSGLSFGGNNGRGNSINVDGSTADTAAGGARSVVSQEAVQEFQVDRNSYNAEFGGASGGVINIVSKTGGNRFHGSAFGYFRDKRFDARNAFDFNPEGKSPYNRQQFGGSIGGPIKQNKTFFFVSGEGLNQNLTSFVTLNDALGTNPFRLAPDTQSSSQNQLLLYLASKPQFAQTAAGLRAVLTNPSARTLNLYASTNGTFPAKDKTALISGRIDHTFSDSDTGFVRFNYAKIDNENQATGALNAVSRGRAIDNPSGGILLSENHTFNNTTINEFRAQFSYYRLKVTPNDPFGPEINILGYGNFGRDIFLPSDSITRQFDLADTVSMVRGAHTIKFGGVFQFNRVSTTSETYLPGTFRFGSLPFGVFFPDPDIRTTANENPVITTIQGDPMLTDQQKLFFLNTLANTSINSLQAYNANLPQVYQQGFGLPGFASNGQKFSVFAQDTWKIRPNMTLNYGLRYYIQKEADPIPIDKNNLQPRLGFSWDVFNNAKTVVRAGAGIFTGQIDNQITNVTNTLASGTEPFNINIVVSAINLPGSFGAARIYQTLLAQGVIGNRQIQASDLAQFGLITTPGRPLEARIRIGQNFENPETYQLSGAIQQDLGGGFVAEASYMYTRGLHIVRPVDVRNYVPLTPALITPSNPVPATCTLVNGVYISRFTGLPCLYVVDRGVFNVPGITLPGVPTPQTLPITLPRYALDAEYQSVANSFYHAGTLQITKRFSRNYSINANYTFAKSIDEATDFNTDYLAQNPFRVRDDRALSAFDQRHRAVFSAVLISPFENAFLKDFVFSPIFTAGSGRPFNLLIGTDTDGDSRLYNDRPAGVARNTGRGEAYYTFDMRLARRFFAKEQRFLELTFEAFNLFNRVNYNGINNVVGTACVENFALNPNCANSSSVIPAQARGIEGVSPTSPLGFTSAAPARQLQFGVRYNF